MTPVRGPWLRAGLAASLAVVAACESTPAEWGKPPPGAKSPPSQLVEGTGYRRAWGGPSAGVALAMSNVTDANSGQLELLKKGQAPIVVSSAADFDAVKISPTEPAFALFLEGVSSAGVGVLQRADLTSGEKVPVVNAERVLAEGFWFGASGDRFLFIGDPNAETSRGKLRWSDGTTSDEVGAGADAAAVIFAKGGEVVYAGTNIDGSGVGSLIRLDMKTGIPKAIDSGVQVLSGRLAAFSVSADGSTVVFASSEGVVKLSKDGGSPTQIAESGSLPGVSADGTTAAWLSGGKLVVSSAGGTPVELGETELDMPPTFSPDKAFVTWFTSLERRGGGLVGDAFVASTAGGSEPVKIGGKVAFDSIYFSEKSPRLSAVVELQDLTGAGSYSGYGSLAIGPPGAAPTSVGVGVRTGGVVPLTYSDRVAFIGNIVPGTGVGEVFVTGAPGTEPVKLGKDVIPGTLRATNGFDRVIYLVDAGEPLSDGTRAGTLYGSDPEGPARLLEKVVVHASLTVDGRALTVVGDGEKSGVWTLPLP